MNRIRQARAEDFAQVLGLLADNALVYEDLTAVNLDTFVVIPAEGDNFPLVAVAGLETFHGSRGRFAALGDGHSGSTRA